MQKSTIRSRVSRLGVFILKDLIENNILRTFQTLA